MDVCPKGHVGRGILENSERVNCGDGTPAFVNHYRCELCGETYIDDECDDPFDEPPTDEQVSNAIDAANWSFGDSPGYDYNED